MNNTTQNPLCNAAIAYATRGFAVFPCTPRGKVPATPHGCRDATKDVAQIAGRWRENPNYNVAAATGPISGVFVLDVDGVDAEAQPDVVRSEYLMHCWMPHQTLGRWFAKYGLQVPPHFTKEGELPAYDGKAKLAAQISRSNARRPGRRPDKIERAKEAMRRDINEGKLTIDGLKAILEKNLVERYGVSRTTARDARKVVLSEFVENSNPANDI
jgi:hypothetical protein